MLSVSQLHNMISSNIAANVSADEPLIKVKSSPCNKTEMSVFMVKNDSEEFVKDTPYVVEFPVAPTSMSCFHIDGEMGDISSLKYKSIKADLKEKTATIKPKNYLQQLAVICMVKYAGVDAGKGKLTFGSDTVPFDVKIIDNPLVVNASAKTDKFLSISGVSTDALSETTVLNAQLASGTLVVPAGATCDLDIEGTKSTIPVVLNKETIEDEEGTTSIESLDFDLSESKIATGKKFSIKCDSKMVEVSTMVKGLEIMDLTGENAFSIIHANSAASIGVAVAIVASAASIMSLFF